MSGVDFSFAYFRTVKQANKVSKSTISGEIYFYFSILCLLKTIWDVTKQQKGIILLIFLSCLVVSTQKIIVLRLCLTTLLNQYKQGFANYLLIQMLSKSQDFCVFNESLAQLLKRLLKNYKQFSLANIFVNYLLRVDGLGNRNIYVSSVQSACVKKKIECYN